MDYPKPFAPKIIQLCETKKETLGLDVNGDVWRMYQDQWVLSMPNDKKRAVPRSLLYYVGDVSVDTD